MRGVYSRDIKSKHKNSKLIERAVRTLFFLCASVSVICVFAITIFVLIKGIPIIAEVGFFNFILGSKWYPSSEIFGIFPMIVGTIYSTAGAVIIGVPIGVLTGIFMTQYSPKFLLKILNPAIDLLAGIPSIVYGFFGLTVIVPIINNTVGGRAGGLSLLAAIIILSVMILPTIVATTRVSLEAVPKEYIEGSIALGASKEHTLLNVMLPAAKSGIFAGIVLGIGRAIGETMAVILIAGNAEIIPKSLTDPFKTLTTTIGLELSHANEKTTQALFACGVILFLFIILLNLFLMFIQRKEGGKK